MDWITTLLRSVSKPLTWWVVVAAWEQGVLVRFGKRTRLLAPGIHFRIPFLDRVATVCVRARVVETNCKTATTSDGQALTYALAIRYSVRDAKEMIEHVASPESTMQALAASSAAQAVALRAKEGLTPSGIADVVTTELRAAVAGWGFDPPTVTLISFAYARPLRLLMAQDSSYRSPMDYALDEKPSTLS